MRDNADAAFGGKAGRPVHWLFGLALLAINTLDLELIVFIQNHARSFVDPVSMRRDCIGADISQRQGSAELFHLARRQAAISGSDADQWRLTQDCD